jgi:hypothetical protein
MILKIGDRGQFDLKKSLGAICLCLLRKKAVGSHCILSKVVGNSVSYTVCTDTGIPVFGTPNTDTDTVKHLPVLAGIENV